MFGEGEFFKRGASPLLDLPLNILGLVPLLAGYSPLGGGGDVLRDKPLMMRGRWVGIDRQKKELGGEVWRGGEAPLLKNSPSPNKILKAFSNAPFGEGD